MRRLLLLLAPALLAASPSPEPPVALAPYIKDGRFDPGDYRWLRGRFEGASSEERKISEEIDSWQLRCRASDMKKIRAELTRMGITPGGSLDEVPVRTRLCAQAASFPWPLDRNDWDGFARDVELVRPIAQAYLVAVATAEMIAAPRTPELRDALNARLIGEQMLRFGFTWAQGVKPDSPVLTLRQRAILVSQIAIATIERDDLNTEWLKGVVAAQGWPRRSQVGDGAAGVAWLLVQHADADPAFQLRALRLMEPLLPSGEVDPKNYAYLYDRVMLKIAGRQRYGTQVTCRGGRYVPKPLENETGVDARRREVGLSTLGEYEKQMIEFAGACPTGLIDR